MSYILPTENLNTGLAPSGFGQQYDQLFKANPYRNLEYRQTGMQRLLSKLGFRTKMDDFYDQMQINAAEYDAGIFSQMQQNEYNSPTAQADRMRAAGLNPDMLGTGDVAGAASPVDDPNGMNLSGGNEIEPLQIVQTVGSAVMNLIPGVMSFATNLSQLKGIRLENDAKELAFNNDALSYAQDFWTSGITEQDYKDAVDSGNWDNIISASEKKSNDLASMLFTSSNAQKKFKMAFGRYSNSLLSELQRYKTYDEIEKARKSWNTSRASITYSPDDDMQVGLIQSILVPFEKYQQKMNEFNLKIAELRDPELEQGLKNTQMENQLEYENVIDPASQAAAENSANAYQKEYIDIMKATNDFFAESMKALDAQGDKWWIPIAKSLLGIARAQLLSGFSVQFGRSQHVAP